MAKNISLLGADYPDVPAVQLPQTGGGTATFYDINVIDNLNSESSTDALSANQGRVLNNKIGNIGSYYTAAWEATENAGLNTRLTKTVTLPAGTYIVVGAFPTMSSSNLPIGATNSGAGNVGIPSIVYGNSGTPVVFTIGLSQQTNVDIRSQFSSAVTFSNLDRGTFRFIRIA